MKNFFFILILFGVINSIYAQINIELNYEDYNDQDVFNSFSGNSGIWSDGGGIADIDCSFDTTYYHGDSGSSLRFDYSVPAGGYGGIWNSLLGKIDSANPDIEANQFLDFTNVFGELKNSTGNPVNVEDVNILSFKFWAKGNGDSIFNHVLKVEFKDLDDVVNYRNFYIPNTSDWTQYEYSVSLMNNVDLTRMKEMVFVIPDWQNNYRTSHFYLDDLTFEIDETIYYESCFSDDEFLDLVSHRAFNYFLIYTDNLDFALDRSTFADMVSVGAIGFQLSAYCIGHSREWANNLESRVENILENLINEVPEGGAAGTDYGCYKGFYYHFLVANTGKRKDDNVELSLYDTMLLMYGVLTAKEYFPNNQNIQDYADFLFDRVEWDWMVDINPGDNQYRFYLGWKPEEGFLGHVDGYTDEALLVDILAVGSDTYPVTMDTYNARERHFGVYPELSSDTLAAAWTGSLFNYFFGSCWLDLELRGIDRHSTFPINIWENNKLATIANRQFCIDHQDFTMWDCDDDYTTYNDSSWGLTACDNLADPLTGMLSEYYAFGALPTQQNIQNLETDAPHLGTISVYGTGSSIMMLPSESIDALKYFYTIPSLWCPLFGFGDSFSMDPHTFQVNPTTFEPIFDEDGNLIIYPATWLNGNWVNNMIMGIDEGPMLLAIENFRSNLIWVVTENNSNIRAGLNNIFGLKPPENVIIYISSGNVNIEWDQVQDASSYTIYSSSNPYASYETWNIEEINITTTNWSEIIPEFNKFYYVVAVDE